LVGAGVPAASIVWFSVNAVNRDNHERVCIGSILAHEAHPDAALEFEQSNQEILAA
jgi:hypothetical protein